MSDIESLHRRYLLDPRPMNLVRWLEALLQAGRHEDTVQAAEAEIVRFPDYPPLRMVLARAYMASGQWDRARTHLEDVLHRDAAHLRAWEALLEVAAAQDRWDDVATCLDNLETLGWEPEKLRLWRERLSAHGLSRTPLPASPCPAWTEAWASAQEAGPVFRRPPDASGVSSTDVGWYNLTVYWSRRESKAGDEPPAES